MTLVRDESTLGDAENRWPTFPNMVNLAEHGRKEREDGTQVVR